jgi:hypothetical protein
MGDTESVRGSATIQQDHVLPVGRHSMCYLATIQRDHVQAVVGRWEIPSQWVVLQLFSEITYFL